MCSLPLNKFSRFWWLGWDFLIFGVTFVDSEKTTLIPARRHRGGTMEVILKEDITNLGKIGEVVRVRDGFARNYLLPRGLVLLANKKNLKVFEHQKKVVADQKQKIMRDAQAVGEQLTGVSLTIAMRSGEEGRLFGSVTNMQIEKALKAKGLNV